MKTACSVYSAVSLEALALKPGISEDLNTPVSARADVQGLSQALKF